MKKATITIVVLVVVALIGILLWRTNKSSNPSTMSQSTTPSASPSPATQPSTPTPAPTSQQPDVKALLAANPGQGATQQEMKDFSAKVSAVSVDTSTVDITACAPVPAVAHVKLHTPITIKNQDPADHKLVNGDIAITVPASSSQSYTPNFAGPGIYGYSCDTKLAGIFLVTP